MRNFSKKLVPLLLLTLTFAPLSSAQTTRDRFNTYLFNDKNSGNPWFEWWYYKVTLPETGESFYAVYGIVNPWDKAKTLQGSRSYVGFGNFNDKIIVDSVYPLDAFHASKEKTDVQIGSKYNTATDTSFTGVVYDEMNQLHAWNVSIEKKWSFNAMGWGMNIPNLTSIAWYPAQADATCTGTITSNGKQHNFKNAPCYQDRNWGKSFPDWWAWIVSNQFNEDPTAVLAAGGGLPEVLGHKIYSGMTVGFKYKGKEYSFRPNDLNRVKTDIKWGHWKIVAQSQKMKLEIEATAPKEKFLDLKFITPEGALFHDYETLTGKMKVDVYLPNPTDQSWSHEATLTSDYAGIEYGSKNENKLLEEMK